MNMYIDRNIPLMKQEYIKVEKNPSAIQIS